MYGHFITFVARRGRYVFVASMSLRARYLKID